MLPSLSGKRAVTNNLGAPASSPATGPAPLGAPASSPATIHRAETPAKTPAFPDSGAARLLKRPSFQRLTPRSVPIQTQPSASSQIALMFSPARPSLMEKLTNFPSLSRLKPLPVPIQRLAFASSYNTLRAALISPFFQV